ncbi:VanZ family protein [Niallia sp. FSL W8-0635]|uniref:VanZ family protein n=1 Tax=Niallia sp. FSL W8-0635 TaxID=2975337 RepID=UPI0009CE6D96|nr:VanZ like family [Mycobacteroides abscessus subsp. abscessus]HEO8418468.1 VanZ family protein [Yersinia enterocolitica]
MKIFFKIIISISFIIYLYVLAILLFFNRTGWTEMTLIMLSSNFVPFKTISMYIQAIFYGNMNLDIPIKNLFGNLFMFLPMGLYLPYFIKRTKQVSVFSIVFLSILFLIEFTQLLIRRGSFDIDDFILNTIGALIGFTIWKKLCKRNAMRG